MRTLHSRTTLPTLALAVAAVLLSSAPARAQLPIPSLSVSGGVVNYKLSSSGTAPTARLALDIPLLLIIGEGSVGIFRAEETGGTSTYVTPEVQLQWQLLPLLVKPYVGVGGGYFRAISGPGFRENQFAASASAGVRVGLPLIGTGFRAEVRMRGLGSGFRTRMTEWTAGISL